ncbi:hypothetical protein A1C50_RS16505 [Acinetobacter baumannii]|uniref:hypothetical protein n=3 Tax=Acinetobacter baumannii TaxID=470 RepID=UPI0003DF3D92|nr:hypothetical protein [Acinetobacter baumannii]KCX65503.1 hypothetical protein J560_4315 [Acinetobacter baumannii 855125]EHU2364962.1 hypothetical protein [Acinetobacter baumannii]ETQ80255.1 hypothetical protein P668_0858 [Acinetobacter baumannii UH5207]KIA11828.1 hypothetical protein RP89_14520 [Acinetobacter baumannii]OTK75664.1 hypothetical protein B9X90_07310 [Acinetobacter baumannii]
MDKPMTFNEWMGKQGNLALVHANCCRIAYEAGQQSMQAKVEELQKLVDELERMFEIKWSDEQIAPQNHSGNRIIYGDCVLGKFSIWWRTWKAWDRPGLEINDEFIKEARDVEEAKQLAKEYLEQALKGENHD